jgi:ABC-type polysaccharide transport system permease subunit
MASVLFFNFVTLNDETLPIINKSKCTNKGEYKGKKKKDTKVNMWKHPSILLATLWQYVENLGSLLNFQDFKIQKKIFF